MEGPVAVAGALELREFVRVHGDVPVPWAFVSTSGFPLGRWLTVQRAKAKADRLGRHRAQSLDAVSQTWRSDLRALRWEEGLAALDRHIKQHGHPQPGLFYSDSTGFPLGRWVKDQRTKHREGLLREDQLSALRVRDFVWVVRDADETWAHHVELLMDYIGENGDARVPPRHVSPDGTRLGNWVRYVRGQRRKGTLQPQRIEELVDLGFMWEVGDGGEKPGNRRRSDAQFARILKELRSEAQRKGTANLPYGYTTDGGTRLGEWLARNRRAFRQGTLAPDRAAALTALGVTLTPRKNHQR